MRATLLKPAQFKLLMAMLFVCLGGCKTDGREIKSRSFQLDYQFTIGNIPEDAKSVIAWIPMPSATTRQLLNGYAVEGGLFHSIVKDGKYGNKYIRFVLLEGVRREGRLGARAIFDVTRRSYPPVSMMREGVEAGRAEIDLFLQPARLIPIDGIIAEEARRVAGDTRGDLKRMKALYLHIVDSIAYDKSGDDWGHGDAIYACNRRTGNCTDFHSLLIGEARSLGIPARFVMGLPLPPDKTEADIAGYHCWAEFYVRGKGWIPMDASEASKTPRRKEELFGSIDANRVQFTTGRDIKLPGSQSPPLNYSIYPHVEVDGGIFPDVERRFIFSERK